MRKITGSCSTAALLNSRPKDGQKEGQRDSTCDRPERGVIREEDTSVRHRALEDSRALRQKKPVLGNYNDHDAGKHWDQVVFNRSYHTLGSSIHLVTEAH